MENGGGKRSRELFAEAKKVTPGGVHSPVRAFRAVGGTPGWPSGHMAVATALVVFFLVRNRDRERTKWAVGIGIGWLAMVAWARWVKRCHTQGQIVAGGVVGCVGGLGLAWALR